jgi:ABC-2 type transport system permease protein
MTGLGQFLRLFARRDRWMVLWWVIGGTLLYYSQAVSVDDLYTTQAEFDRAAAAMEGNAAFVAMAGPARALNTIGGQVTWQSTAFGAILAGLMSMFIVGRHTRAGEESGRDELLRAAPVGRLATTTGALVTALMANVLLGGLVAVSLVSYPLEAADSVALGVGLALCGWVFTGAALVAAQLTASTRSMYGIAGAGIGLAYVLRAVGDVGNQALSWLSPIGWYQQMYPFSGLRWWPALLLVAATGISVVIAYLLHGRRDYGAGLFADRPGPDRAPAALRTGWGLAWRLQRGAVLGWCLGLFFIGVAYGALGNDVGDLLGDSEASREILVQGGAGLVDGFYATAIMTLALVGSGFAISSALRPRGEEDNGLLEPVLATALSRERWLLGHVAATVLGVLAVAVASGLGVGVGYALITGDLPEGRRYAVAILAYVPAVLVLAAAGRLVYGIAPRFGVLAWVPLAVSAVVMIFGDLLQLPQWLQDLSPFEHLALVPAEDFRMAPFLAVLAVAVVVSGAGQLAFRRRDVG